MRHPGRRAEPGSRPDLPLPVPLGRGTLDAVYEGLDLPRTSPGGPPLRRVYELLAEHAGAEA